MRFVYAARLALLVAAGAVLLPLVVAGLWSGLLVLLVTAGAVTVALAAVWWFLSRRGLLRWLAFALFTAAVAIVLVAHVRAGLLWALCVSGLLWAGAAAVARWALTRTAGPAGHRASPPRRPYLLMNERSGGGKVISFRLADRARALGATVAFLRGPDVDVARLARRAVAGGADLLGVAGGDGTQAAVAAVAAAHGLPFLVIPAGTRNHFALDLGLDLADPAAALDALVDGVEVRADLGRAGDLVFVNNASFGAYAAVVRSPAYRDDKTRTALDLLPGLLADGPRLDVRAGTLSRTAAQAVLISNNAYAAGGFAGQRARLDGGVLGVIAVTARGAADVVRGSAAVATATATAATIRAAGPTVLAGVDGEAVVLPAPVRCVIQPGALRVRVPRHRPRNRGPVDWRRLWSLAGSSTVPV